jgi:hypothetical protein
MALKPWRAAYAATGLLGALVTVVWATWPLTASLTTHVAGSASCDAFYSTWALAWQTHVLTTDPARYFDANIYHPVRDALAYGPTAMGALPLFGPVFALSRNPALATNALFLGGSALTAWTIGLVAARWTRSAAAGVVAGATYLAAPWVLYQWVPRVPHFAMLVWIPLIVDRAARPLHRLRDALVLAAMVALQAAVEVVYIAPALLVPLALVTTVRLLRRSTRVSGLYLGMALLAALIALSPLLHAHVAVRRANPKLALQTAWRSDKPPLPGRGPLELPWDLFGWWKRAGGVLDAPPPMAVPPLAFGLIACGVVSRALRRRRDTDEQAVRAWHHAALWTAAGVVLALPAEGVVFGAHVRLPYAWLRDDLPLVDLVRVPMRLGTIGLVGLSLLAGLAFDEVVGRAASGRWRAWRWAHVTSGALAAMAAAAIVAQPRIGMGYPPGFVAPRLPPTYPLREFPGETPYASTLRAGHGPLLEIGKGPFRPPQWRPEPESLAMIRSIGHWRPLLNGYSSYWPAQYARSMSLASRLPEDPDALAALRTETGVELILVWPEELPPAKREAWDALARAPGSPALDLIGAGQQGALLFRVGDT